MRNRCGKKKVEQLEPASQIKQTTTAAKTKAAARPVLPSVSIKQAMAGNYEPQTDSVATKEQPSEEVATVSKAGNKPITTENLIAAWNSFAGALKTENTRLYSALTAYTPNIEDETKIIFKISNPLQKEPLQKIKSKLLQHLQTVLDNGKAEIEFIFAEKSETSKTAYTNEEKFAQMICKNPTLMTFKQQLSLDFF